MADRDLLSYFYSSPRTTAPSHAETIRSIRAALGGPGVAVFEAMQRANPKERGRIASVVQAEFRKLMQHRIEPVLPRSSSKPAQQQPTGARRR